MKDEKKNKIQLLEELQALRRQVAELTTRDGAGLSDQTLRESEERYRILADYAADFISRYTPTGVCTYASPACRVLIGYEPEELLGGTPVDFTHPDDAARVRDTMRQLLRTPGGTQAVEYRSRRKDGSSGWIETTAQALRDLRTGLVQEVIAVSRDMTARKRVEEALHQSRAELELRVEERTVALARANDTLRQEIAERTQAEERVRQQLTRLQLLNQITRAIGERQDLDSIFRVVMGSLEESLPLDFSCICLFDTDGEGLRVASVGAKGQRMATTLGMQEGAHVPIDQNGLRACARGNTVYEPDTALVNAAIPQQFARAGLYSLAAAPMIVEGSVLGILLVARQTVNGLRSGECEFLRQLSEHVAIAAHQAQLYAELQQAYDDLRQTQHAAMQQERLRAVGQMASGIAHDINNAISPVMLYTDALLEGEPQLSDRGRQYLTNMQQSIDDVARTVARLREFYRTREEPGELLPVNVNQLVSQVVELTRAKWRDLAQQHGITNIVETTLQADLPTILGAESDIRDGLTNLIFNAVDAMPAGGTLTLRTSATPTHVRLEVTDTGVGMDEETRQRCVEPFYTTKGERGTGLGLAMVYGMVQRHAGTMEIESTPGKGTTMRLLFLIPRGVIDDRPAAGSVPVLLLRRRVLVVDDDPMLRKVLADILTAEGHWVMVADGGQQGIAAFRSATERGEPFEVVVTDLGMPHIDGREVARAVKAESPTTPVILLTGWGQRLQAEGETPTHVDLVLSKPPKIRDLREALAAVCDGGTGHHGK